MGCQPAGRKAATLRARVVGYASDSDAAPLRADLGLGSVDTATIAIVTSDSVCNAVTRAVNAHAQHPRATSLLVVRFGSFFAACDPEGDMIVSIYILDDRFTIKTIMVST
jgi:hypothetical protein